MKQIGTTRYWALFAVIAAATLAFDLNHPLGVAAGIPYILIVLLGMMTRDYRTIFVLTATASTLNAIGLAYSAAGAPTDVVILNRGMALLATWSVAGAACMVAMQRKSLEQQVLIDPLTSSYNRKYLSEVLDHETTVSKALGRPLSVIMLDVDHFKKINDLYGHLAGDSVLRELTQVCSAHIREADRICRYGGEEFAIVLPDADQNKAGVVAERIRRAVRDNRFAGTGGIEVTVSLGVAEMSPSCSVPDTLLKAADIALYNAKNAGRNRVRFDGAGKLRLQCLQAGS